MVKSNNGWLFTRFSSKDRLIFEQPRLLLLLLFQFFRRRRRIDLHCFGRSKNETDVQCHERDTDRTTITKCSCDSSSPSSSSRSLLSNTDSNACMQTMGAILALVYISPGLKVKLISLWSSRFRFPMDEKKTNEYSTSCIDHSIFVRSNRDQGKWSIEWIIALVVVVIIIVVLVHSFFPLVRTETNLTSTSLPSAMPWSISTENENENKNKNRSK